MMPDTALGRNAMTSSTPSPQDAFVQSRLINLVRSGAALTRPALEQESGLGRKVVAQRVQQAIDTGLLEDADLAPSGGGRPSRQLRFRAEAGHVYAAVIGATECRVAVATLDGAVIADMQRDWRADEGPEATMEMLDGLFTRLARRTRTEPWAFGVGVSGPVSFGSGRIVAPPILPGWDGHSVRTWFRERYDAPVWVDNDVNLMALAEWHLGDPQDGRDLLYILVDEGVGAGLVSRGQVWRGDSGAAGDIGHLQVTDDPDVLCRCGQTGCLEALSGGWSLVQRVTDRVAESPALARLVERHGQLTAEDVGMAARDGDALAREVVLSSARLVGTTVANLVNFVNPGTVVLGGGALRVGDAVFDTFAETVRGRVSRLAGQQLTIRRASLGFQEGVAGAAILAIEQLFAPASLGLWVEHGSPVGRAAHLQQVAVG
jgi:predicted NBD/HSP70 family sugar kinase